MFLKFTLKFTLEKHKFPSHSPQFCSFPLTLVSLVRCEFKFSFNRSSNIIMNMWFSLVSTVISTESVPTLEVVRWCCCSLFHESAI
ncbi:hypothetical protein Hanom_Chr14g01279551 [Helianthus anomalus]